MTSTTSGGHTGRAGSTPRTTIQLLMAAVITAPAAWHALDGTAPLSRVGLVFVIALSAIWILSAAAMSLGSWFDRFTATTAGPSRPVTGEAAAPATEPSHALGRVPVAQVPAHQAVHADEHGNLTAADTGEMR